MITIMRFKNIIKSRNNVQNFAIDFITIKKPGYNFSYDEICSL